MIEDQLICDESRYAGIDQVVRQAQERPAIPGSNFLGYALPFRAQRSRARRDGAQALDEIGMSQHNLLYRERKIGCGVEAWTIMIGPGPGRATSKITAEFNGTGKLTEPSAISMPAATLEKLLPSASLAVDYVTNKNIVSLETPWKNNIKMDAGFLPGSGFQTSGDATTGAIRGRLEFGDRQGTLKFTARFDNISTELTKLKAQTTGTATILPVRCEQLAVDHLAEGHSQRWKWARRISSSRRCGMYTDDATNGTFALRAI